MDDTTDPTDGSKAKRWIRHLDIGVELAKMCLKSNMNALESTGMCFIMATKFLPTDIKEKLAPDMFRYALNQFIKAPIDSSNYLKTFQESDDLHLLKLGNDNNEIRIDPITNKPISLSSFLADCPTNVYSALLQSLLTRSQTLQDGLFPHTAAIWSIIIKTKVPPAQTKAKR